MILILDYGIIGNIHSLKKALDLFSKEVIVSSDPRDVKRADAIVLPGVGAFEAGIEGLKKRGLAKEFVSAVKKGAPTLGICLGAQLLMNSSEEMGHWEGLGLIDGTVVSLPFQERYRVPHIGWSAIRPPKENDWGSTILKNIKPGDEMYFLHSFIIKAPGKELAFCDYGDVTFTAAVRYDNVYAIQFHPEKSGSAGLRILEEFVKLSQ